MTPLPLPYPILPPTPDQLSHISHWRRRCAVPRRLGQQGAGHGCGCQCLLPRQLRHRAVAGGARAGADGDAQAARCAGPRRRVAGGTVLRGRGRLPAAATDDARAVRGAGQRPTTCCGLQLEHGARGSNRLSDPWVHSWLPSVSRSSGASRRRHRGKAMLQSHGAELIPQLIYPMIIAHVIQV
ncbi:unnamed protein product [Urochloa humidicola]